jgi:predicted nucleic acid-binding protein
MMIVYFDTSAFVPLVMDAAGTAVCTRLWESADSVVSTRIVYVETASALARANRAGKLSTAAHAQALAVQDELWRSVSIADLDEPMMARAAELAKQCGLRGYDAVHCAAAELLNEPNLVAASGDVELLGAWRKLGVATFPVLDR